jgi:hypothetical protein
MKPKQARPIQSIQWLPAKRFCRSRVALRGAPLLMQEIFLSAMGRS